MLKIQIDNDKRSSIERLCRSLETTIKTAVAERGVCNLAISGGRTALDIFDVLRDGFGDIKWSGVHIFWVDERCVPPKDISSNYGEAEKFFISPLKIPSENVFRLRGEECPVLECQRYSRFVKLCVQERVGDVPSFDCIILGVGADAHTASIFSETMNLLTDSRLYSVSFNPATHLWRMTMTARTILAAKKILVPIYGEEKSHMLKKLIRNLTSFCDSTPASYVLSRAKFAEMFTDIKIA